MKTKGLLKMTLMSLAVVLGSCKTQTSVQTPANDSSKNANTTQMQVLRKVTDNAQYAQYITSKIRFKVKLGEKEVALGGSLKMKRNDVIRLQLTALGLIEAGRMEFTKDYVLVMDRINKQYIKVNYDQVDFLRQSGLNFYSLQALFWNELFLPGADGVTDEGLKNFAVDMSGTDNAITLNQGKLRYQWQADKSQSLIRRFDGTYADNAVGKFKIDWAYNTFQAMGSKKFPTVDNISVTVPGRNITVDLQLASPNNDSNWETRTEVNSRYRQVSLDEIIRKLSAL